MTYNSCQTQPLQYKNKQSNITRNWHVYVLRVCCYDPALWRNGLIFLNFFKHARVLLEYAACCIWKCRLWLHLLSLPLPFRQKQSVQPIVCILPPTGNQYQPIYFHLPNATVGFGCFKWQRKRAREKKKLDRQWLELNIVLPGRNQHPLRGYIFYTEIIASVLLCMCFTVSVFHFGPCDREPEVVCLLGNCFLEVAPFLQTCLIWRRDWC